MRVLKIFEGWVMVQTPDRYIGWTNKNAVQLMTYSEITHWQKSPRMMYLRGDGSLFSDLSKTSVVSDLVAGAIVVMIDNHKRNIKVELPDGRTGFVSSQDWVNFNSWRDTVMLRSEPMITFGKQFMGFPYLWGGTSSKGMDCSGFVKTVCFLNGIILERDASQQIHHGVEIDITQGYDKLQKGDLLFFGSRTPYRVNHVGIYIGNSEVIHESGNVHINSLEKSRTNFNPELSANLVGARRIIGASAEQGILPTRMHQWY